MRKKYKIMLLDVATNISHEILHLPDNIEGVQINTSLSLTPPYIYGRTISLDTMRFIKEDKDFILNSYFSGTYSLKADFYWENELIGTFIVDFQSISWTDYYVEVGVKRSLLYDKLTNYGEQDVVTPTTFPINQNNSLNFTVKRKDKYSWRAYYSSLTPADVGEIKHGGSEGVINGDSAFEFGFPVDIQSVTQVGSASNSPISGLVPSLFTLPITDGGLSSKLTSINVKFKRLEPTPFMIGNSWVTPKVVVSLMYVVEYQDYSGINHFTPGTGIWKRDFYYQNSPYIGDVHGNSNLQELNFNFVAVNQAPFDGSLSQLPMCRKAWLHVFFYPHAGWTEGYPSSNVVYADLSFDLDFEANINTQLLSFSGVLQGNTVAEYLNSTGMFNCAANNFDNTYKVIGGKLNPHIVAADVSKLLGMCFFENEENKYTPFQLNEYMFNPPIHIAEGDTYDWSFENIEQVAQVLFSDIHKFSNFRNLELEKTDLKITGKYSAIDIVHFVRALSLNSKDEEFAIVKYSNGIIDLMALQDIPLNSLELAKMYNDYPVMPVVKPSSAIEDTPLEASYYPVTRIFKPYFAKFKIKAKNLTFFDTTPHVLEINGIKYFVVETTSLDYFSTAEVKALIFN